MIEGSVGQLRDLPGLTWDLLAKTDLKRIRFFYTAKT